MQIIPSQLANSTLRCVTTSEPRDWQKDRRTSLATLAALLLDEIENLVDHRAYLSDRAITPSGTRHNIIKNGYLIKEGEESPLKVLPLCAAYMSLETARSLRLKLGKDAYIVWRAKPEFDDDANLYMRLCFEAL